MVALLALYPCTAFAHGEMVILGFVAALAAAVGALAGLLGVFFARCRAITWPIWFATYLVIGSVIAGLAVMDLEGAMLFLTFGGIGGVLPFVALFFAARATGAVATSLKRLMTRGGARE